LPVWFRTLAQSVDFAVVALDEHGDPEYLNPPAEALLAGDRDGRDAAWLRLLSEIQPHLPAPEAAPARLSLDRPDGAGRLDVELVPVVAEDRTGHLVLLRETAPAPAERELLALAQRRTGASLYSAQSHDLRGPLNTMVINLELLKTTVRPDHPKQERYVRVLAEELTRLTRALLPFLEQLRPPRGRHGRVDVKEVVKEVEELLTPQARKQRARLETWVGDQELVVSGDRELLRLAVLALAVNAFEAVDGRQGTVEILAQRSGSRAVVAVVDDGPGIAGAERDKIFEPTYTTKGEGGGFGLAAARLIAGGHDGELRLADTEDGSRFELILPCDPKEA
jgi:signal transduction histidine kinase